MKEKDILVTFLSYMCNVLEEADDSKGSGGVEARGGLVEKDEGGVGENLLTNAHTLTFTSRDSTQELVSDDGVMATL